MPGGAGNPKRASVVLQPMAGGIGFDYESSDEEDNSPAPVVQPNGTGTGGPNHRPMVGGFAAAAYEAARAHHYAAQQKKKKNKNGDGRRPQS